MSYVPDFLRDFVYWVFFIEPNLHEHLHSDGSLVVRRYPEGAEMRVLPDTGAATSGPLLFHEVQDYPSGLAIRKVLSDEPALLETYIARSGELSERYPCHEGIKLGGYPHLIQETAFLEKLDVDYQIQLDATDFYTFGDSGIGYMYGDLSAIIWESM